MNYPNKISNVRIVYEPDVVPSERCKIVRVEDAVKIAEESWEGIYHHESFRIMLLDSANQVIGIHTVGVGGAASTPVDVRICLQAALLGNAVSVIALHNHPTGRMWPSENDESLTEKLNNAFVQVGLSMVDHIIVGGGGKYYSFASEGKL